MSSATFKIGDLTAVIGDNSAEDEHRAGYNGVWELRQAKGTRSLFVPGIAGLNHEHLFNGKPADDSKVFFEPRHAPMTANPAWDFQWIIPQPDVMKEYGFQARTVVRPRCSRDEVLEEYEKWKASSQKLRSAASGAARGRFVNSS